MISQFADRLVHIALIGIVYKIAPGSTFQLAKILFFTAVPSFFISPIAGVYIDRLNKKNVLIWSDIIRSIMVLSLPLIFLQYNSLIPLYCIILIVFASACFFLPAKLSIIPELVDKKNLLMANSFSMASWTAAGIIGFIAGSFLIEFYGIKKGFYINSFTYFMSAFILSFMVIHKKDIKDKLSLNDVRITFRKSFLYELKEGILYLLSHKNARFAVGIFFLFMSLVGSLYVVTIVFIQELTHSMTGSLGVFGTFFFLGFLIGSYIHGRIGHNINKGKTIFFSFMLNGIFISLFVFFMKVASLLWGGYFSLFLVGLSMSPIASSANTIIHETIDENMRGRIFSSIGIIMNSGFIIFMFCASFMAEYIGRLLVILLCGFGFFMIGIIGYFLNRKEGYIISRTS